MKLPPLLLLNLLLTWVIFLGGMYSFWRFYPPVEESRFSPSEAAKKLAEWRPLVEREVSLEKPDIAQGKGTRLNPGIYFCRSLGQGGKTGLFTANTINGDTEQLAELDENETPFKISTDSKRRFLVLWSDIQMDKKWEMRFRIFDINSRKWRQFNTVNGSSPFFTGDFSSFDVFRLDKVAFSIRGRYFFFLTDLHSEYPDYSPPLIWEFFNMENFIVLDAEKEDIFSLQTLNPYFLPFQRDIIDIDRDSGSVKLYGGTYEYLPYHRMQISLIKIIEADIASGEVRGVETKGFHRDLFNALPLDADNFLVIEFSANERPISVIREGRFIVLGEGPGKLFSVNATRFNYFNNLDVLVIEENRMYEAGNYNTRARISWLNLNTEEFSFIADIPAELYDSPFCLFASTEANVACVPLHYIEKDEAGQEKSSYTEFRFYDVANQRQAGSLKVPGKVYAPALILSKGDYYPQPGEVVISPEMHSLN
jgi:hypothetical protein